LKRGAKLATWLGRGWKVKVHENLGWHVTVVSPCGRLKVTGGGDRYTCFLSPAGETGGQFVGQANTPQGAVGYAIAKGFAALGNLEQLMRGLDKAQTET
jgi:hypothetical protein